MVSGGERSGDTRRVGRAWRKPAFIALGLGGVIAAWEALVFALGIKPFLLPAPSLVLRQTARRWDVVADAALFTAQSMLVGFVASAGSAALAVRWLVAWLQSRGLELFAFWRIGLAAVVAALLASGVLPAG